MACDPNELLEEAKCIMYCVPRGANEAIKIVLLCDTLTRLEPCCILTELGADLNAETDICLLTEQTCF